MQIVSIFEKNVYIFNKDKIIVFNYFTKFETHHFV